MRRYRRLAEPDVPIPYSRPLEQFVFPSAEKIAAAAQSAVA
jgi:acetoin:2,6-dichlorophenolindophenol oxidoreductase subunit beta